MRRPRLSRLALGDMDAIAAYIAREDFAAALLVIDALHAAASRLCRMPGIGHTRQDLTSRRVLFWPVHSYLMVYRRMRSGIEVVRVLHAARDVRRLLREEE